jgi:hypothetical protein
MQRQWNQHSKPGFRSLQVPRLDATRWSGSQSRILEGVTWLSYCPVVTMSNSLYLWAKGSIKNTSRVDNCQKQYILKWSKKAERYPKEPHKVFPVSPNNSSFITRLICSVKTNSPIQVKLQDVQRATQDLVPMSP